MLIQQSAVAAGVGVDYGPVERPSPDYPSISRAASLAFMPSRTPLR